MGQAKSRKKEIMELKPTYKLRRWTDETKGADGAITYSYRYYLDISICENGVDMDRDIVPIGAFATDEDARPTAEEQFRNYLHMMEKRTVYRYEKLGMVSVDVGAIIIADPCRLNSLATTQNEDDLITSPLMPEDISKQIVDAERHPKVANPTRLEDFGHTQGEALSLRTGFGDGYYDVYAEIVDYGELLGERIAAIHMQFVNDEDLLPYRKLAKNQTKAATVRRN